MSRGTKWDDFVSDNEILTADERIEIDLKVRIIGEILKARQEKGITQRELEAISGVKQPFIARIERNTVDPQLTTILKLLQPLGLTLQVVANTTTQTKRA